MGNASETEKSKEWSVNFTITNKMKTKQELQQELARLKELVKQTEEKIKNVLEVGKWYKVSELRNGCLGFNGFGQIVDDVNVNSGLYEGDMDTITIRQVDGKSWRINRNAKFNEVSPQEVQQALIKEAEKRGFKEGVTSICLLDDSNTKLADEGCMILSCCNNKLFAHGCCIFSNGKWAEIIAEPEYKDGDIVVATIGEWEYLIKFKEYIKLDKRTIQAHNFISNEDDGILTGGKFESIKRIATDEEKEVFNNLANPKPKIGDVCKFWDVDEDIFVIGKLNSIDTESQYKFVIADITNAPYYFINAKTLTQQQAIDLLFNS